MENVSATTMTDCLLVDDETANERYEEDTVAHELAHQWFGDFVTTRDWANIWLNEGWATFMELMWAEHAHGLDEAYCERAGDSAWYKSESLEYQRPIVTAVFPYSVSMFDAHTYAKGGLVLHMLRRLLGDERFWAGVREYLHRHAYGNVDTRDFQLAMQDASGERSTVFQQWIFAPGTPKLEASWSFSEADRAVKIDVKQTQKHDGGVPTYRLPTTVELWYGAPPTAPHVEKSVVIDADEQTLWIPSQARPELVLVDAAHDLLADVTYPDCEAAETAAALHHPRVAARLDAAEALGGGAPRPEAVARSPRASPAIRASRCARRARPRSA